MSKFLNTTNDLIKLDNDYICFHITLNDSEYNEFISILKTEKIGVVIYKNVYEYYFIFYKQLETKNIVKSISSITFFGKAVKWIVNENISKTGFNCIEDCRKEDLSRIPFYLYPIIKDEELLTLLKSSNININTYITSIFNVEYKNYKILDRKNCIYVSKLWNIFSDQKITEDEVIRIIDSCSYHLDKVNFSAKDNPSYYRDVAIHIIKKTSMCVKDGIIYYYDAVKKYHKAWLTEEETNEIKRYINNLNEGYYKNGNIIEICEKIYLEAYKNNTAIEFPKEKYFATKTQLINWDGNEIKVSNKTSLKFVDNYIDYDYDENAYDEFIDKFLNEVLVEKGCPEQRLLFEEFLGSIFFDIYDITKTAIIIYGESGTLKSRFCSMIKNLLSGFSSNISLHRLKEEENKLITNLVNKKINVDDDMSEHPLSADNVTAIKKLIGGADKFTISPLFQESKEVEIKIKILGATNKIPKITQFEPAVFNRFKIIKFNKEEPESWTGFGTCQAGQINHLFNNENAKKYLFKLAVDGWKRFLNNKSNFTVSPINEEEKKKWIIESSDFLSYINTRASGKDMKTFIMTEDINDIVGGINFDGSATGFYATIPHLKRYFFKKPTLLKHIETLYQDLKYDETSKSFIIKIKGAKNE